MEYNWFKKFALSRLKQLEKFDTDDPITRKKIEDIKILLDLVFSYSTSKNCVDTETLTALQKIKLLFREYNELMKYPFLLDDFATFQNSSILHFTSFTLPNEFYSKKTIIELMKDFYKNGTNQEINESFSRIYLRNKNSLHFINITNQTFLGDSLYLPIFNDFFVHVIRQNNFDDLATAIHEYGHGIQYFKNFNISLFFDNYVFNEIVSQFFEFLSYLYFINTNSSLKQVAIMDLVNSYNKIKHKVIDINKFIMLCKKLKINSSTSDEEIIASILCNVTREEQVQIDYFIKNDVSNSIPYVFGFMVAIELIHIYFNSPQIAFDTLFRLMKIDANILPQQYYEKIIDLELLPGYSIKGFENEIDKNLAKL